MKICVVTSMPPGAEPRAPRHAVAAKQAFPDAEVVFFELAAAGSDMPDPPGLAEAGLVRRKVTYPTRKNGVWALVWRRLRVIAARIWMSLLGLPTEAVFGERVVGLTGKLKREKADVYIAHNIETLLPAARAATAAGGKLIFDCMEYYSDMGDSQTVGEARAANLLEREWLKRCVLVTASSDALADVLANEYGIERPLPLYNTPPLSPAPPAREPIQGLDLYWRNSVVGFGQRGLDDILQAMTRLPEDVILSVQGRAPTDGGAQLKRRIAELELEGRVRVLPPYKPGEAVEQAQMHMVGLCLERHGPTNHEYTVSNKLFDYMMAGLAVVVSDMPSLKTVVERAKAGLVYEAASPDDLAAKIRSLRDNPRRRETLAANARKFAVKEGNVEIDAARFRAALVDVLGD